MSALGKMITEAMGVMMNFNPEKNKNIIKTTQNMGNINTTKKLVGYYNDRIDVDGCPMEIFAKRETDNEKIIFFLHGGAYIGELTGLYRTYARYFINQTGAKIFMPDYRVAPEHTFPAALIDAEKCWNYLMTHGYNAKDIIVIGDSAGGNLALSLMLKLRDSKRTMPYAAVFLSPWADMTASGDSYVYNYPNDVMFGFRGKEFEEEKRQALLACDIFAYFKENDRTNPAISPVFGEYHGFPECFFVAAKNEMLLSDTLTIAEKINAAGGKAEVFAEHEMFHVYPILVEACPEAKEANKKIVEFMNKKFYDRTVEKNKEIEHNLITAERKKLYTKFVKAIKDYQLIEDGDKIAVCISGGKDSMLLAKCMQELKAHGIDNFEVRYIVMDPGYTDFNLLQIKNNLELLNIPAEIFESDIFAITEEIIEEGNPCYMCARMRRGWLYAKAKELGCNKIALGHHFDDVIETTLMGMLYNGQVQTMLPKLKSENFEGMELIRPLYYVREKDIIAWQKNNGLQFIRCACQFSEKAENGVAESKRQRTKELIELLEKENRSIPMNIFRSVQNVQLGAVIEYKDKLGKRHNFLDENF